LIRSGSAFSFVCSISSTNFVGLNVFLYVWLAVIAALVFSARVKGYIQVN
jgi:hypothetical protein